MCGGGGTRAQKIKGIPHRRPRFSAAHRPLLRRAPLKPVRIPGPRLVPLGGRRGRRIPGVQGVDGLLGIGRGHGRGRRGTHPVFQLPPGLGGGGAGVGGAGGWGGHSGGGRGVWEVRGGCVCACVCAGGGGGGTRPRERKVAGGSEKQHNSTCPARLRHTQRNPARSTRPQTQAQTRPGVPQRAQRCIDARRPHTDTRPRPVPARVFVVGSRAAPGAHGPLARRPRPPPPPPPLPLPLPPATMPGWRA